MNTILVTGGAGFIGSNFIRMLRRQSPEDTIVNLDALTYAGNPENLRDIHDTPGYVFIHANICDEQAVDAVFAQYKPRFVVNFAAESSVDRSIASPDVFVRTNVLGTQVLLETARRHWTTNGGAPYSGGWQQGVKFLQVSTDEVYGESGNSAAFTEESALAPNNPYAASKASADLLVRAYHQTYGLPVNITRSSNNYGPFQLPEKLIPRMICKAMAGQPLPIYGSGLQRRDWLHVEDNCDAIALVLRKGKDGEIYNIGGSCEKHNLEVVKAIVSQLKTPETLIAHVEDRPGHDHRYVLDSAKLTAELGWRPRHTFGEGIRETVRWYQGHAEWLAPLAPAFITGEG